MSCHGDQYVLQQGTLRHSDQCVQVREMREIIKGKFSRLMCVKVIRMPFLWGDVILVFSLTGRGSSIFFLAEDFTTSIVFN